MYDFSGLTKTQKMLLTQRGWDLESAGIQSPPSKRTVAKLIERGLVVESVRAYGRFEIREYAVPIAVYEAWSASKSMRKKSPR